MAAEDGAEDVSDFLRRIKELGETPGSEDAGLEHEILESRRLRQARREERARSLSPNKQAPFSPSPRSPPKTASFAEPPILSPVRTPNIFSANKRDEEPGRSHLKESNSQSLKDPESSLASPFRQSVRTVGPSQQSRPSSMVFSSGAVESKGSVNTDRASIMQSLGQKDPSWFRQTADRGVKSAAYRRDQSESEPTADKAPSVPFRLQGLTSKAGLEQNEQYLAEDESASDSRLAADTPSVVSLPSDTDAGTDPADRIASPTKGVGGFVQSAMLRRNESVNKRWSAQNTPGVSRQNSSAAFRSVHGREHSVDNKSISGDKASDDVFSGHTTFSRRSRSPTKASEGGALDHADRTPTSSPQKRWSPVKSSWLESALNKPPESPRSTRTTHSQPSWLSDLNKNRQSRASKDETQNIAANNGTSTLSEDKAQPSTATGAQALSSVDQAERMKPRQPEASQQVLDSLPDPKTTKAVHTEPADAVANQSSEATDAISPIFKSRPVKAHDSVVPTEAGNSRGPSSKSKPITPPKRDLNLGKPGPGPRPASVVGEKPQLEFQNAFGRLRRAQTQNYVAPDELKDNILRGKSGLAVTGGPKKSERVDEFKDSLLRSRASMKEKAKDPPLARASQSNFRNITPEAIVKRRAMGRSEGSVAISTPSQPPSEDKAQAPSLKPKPSAPLRPPASELSTPSATSEEASSKTGVDLSGKLANRFNPALANMIARGPPALSGSPVTSPPSHETPMERQIKADAAVGGPLDHMTKSRARGPKRRPPKVEESSKHPTEDDTGGPIKAIDAGASIPSKVPPAVESKAKPESLRAPPTPQRLGPVTPSRNGSDSIKSATTASASPLQPNKVDARTWQAALPVVTRQPGAGKSKSSSSPTTDTASKQTNIASNEGHSAETSATRPKFAVSDNTVGRIAPKAGPKPPHSMTEKAYGTDQKPTTDKPSTAPKSPLLTKSAAAAPPLAVSPSQESDPIAKVEHLQQHQGSEERSSVAKHQLSPRSQTNDASHLLSEFFDTTKQAPAQVSMNVSDMLSGSSIGDAEDFQTLDCDVSTLSGDGKRAPLPLSQQPILFDNEMYLIKHTMKDSTGGQRSEIYFRTGNEVPASAVDDGQLFAKRFAKESNGSLLAFQQGKEPPRLFQALGDIVITRKRSFARDGPYMLCGRKHLGRYVAFDEVAFQLSSFCSGYTFVIHGGEGSKMYLWKGKGSTADEISSAQMVSMNLSVSGEVDLIEEGSEPESFVDLFPLPTGKKPVKAVPRSADHWRLKSQHGNYNTRLFRVSYHAKAEGSGNESRAAPGSPGASLWNFMGRRGSSADVTTNRPQQVHEIRPYCQADLERDQVYVLDAFFEIYILVGPESRAKWASFVTALLFAQDYSILAAGSQDRPFVPVGTVIMQGAPRDLKACFRGWDESSGLFGRGRDEEPAASGKTLRIIPLSAALVAAKP